MLVERCLINMCVTWLLVLAYNKNYWCSPSKNVQDFQLNLCCLRSLHTFQVYETSNSCTKHGFSIPFMGVWAKVSSVTLEAKKNERVFFFIYKKRFNITKKKTLIEHLKEMRSKTEARNAEYVNGSEFVRGARYLTFTFIFSLLESLKRILLAWSKGVGVDSIVSWLGIRCVGGCFMFHGCFVIGFHRITVGGRIIVERIFYSWIRSYCSWLGCSQRNTRDCVVIQGIFHD